MPLSASSSNDIAVAAQLQHALRTLHSVDRSHPELLSVLEMIVEKLEEDTRPRYLYHVERTDEIDYDEYRSFVVCAISKEAVIKTIDEKLKYRGYWKWENVQIVKIGTAAKDAAKRPEILIGSYNAG